MSSPATNEPSVLSGRFICYVRPAFERQAHRILYIGKATSGVFDEENASEEWFAGNGPFWSFARSVSKLADPNCTDLSNLAWSNIFKQGVTKGNPRGAVAGAQTSEAIKSLREEVIRLGPTLILLVTAGYYEEVPKAAFDIDNGEIGPKAFTRTQIPGENTIDLWSRPRYGTFPAIVWMYHPQGKSKAYLHAARRLIAATAGWE